MWEHLTSFYFEARNQNWPDFYIYLYSLFIQDFILPDWVGAPTRISLLLVVLWPLFSQYSKKELFWRILQPHFVSNYSTKFFCDTLTTFLTGLNKRNFFPVNAQAFKSFKSRENFFSKKCVLRLANKHRSLISRLV